MNAMNRWKIGAFWVCVLLLAVSTAVAQETTAAIQGTVKDATGAVVANATVEISGPSLIGTKKATTDSSGLYKISNLPPGAYVLTVSAQGFRQSKRSSIDLSAGRLPIIDVQLEVGANTETVEVTGAAPIVDVTQSKVAVTVDKDIIADIPKGRSFQSVIPFAPGARQEPLTSDRNNASGRNSGYQVDGATDSENVYMVDGVNVTDIRGGGVGKNFQMDFIQEVQIKSGGFEAEFGGALGGVVNAVPKRGSNNWHGGFLTYMRFSGLNANDPCAVPHNPYGTTATAAADAQYGVSCFLRTVPGTGAVGRLAPPTEYYIPKKDNRTVIEPGFELAGALMKDRLWLFTSYIPTIDNLSRTINYTGATPGPRTLQQKYTQHNAYTRLDYRMFNQLQLYGAWNYAYSRWTGPLHRPDSVTGQVNSDGGQDPNKTILPAQGVALPSAVYTFGGDWSPTSKLVVTARYGYTFTNGSDRGKASGLAYVYNQNLSATTPDITGTPFATGTLIQNAPFSNLGDNKQTKFDAYKRKSWNADAAYFVGHLLGSHNFKWGYMWMDQGNEVFSAFNFARVTLDWNNKYTPQTSTTACDAIIAQNIATYGAPSGPNDPRGQCRGRYGFFTVNDGVDNEGKASNIAQALYVQDAWTVGHGLTLNVGVRFDRETVPAFDPKRFNDIEFGWGSKIAPRIGGAYDLFRNGKVKIYASYGKFFDITKLGLSRGSFGSDYWHDCVYALDNPTYTLITPTAPGGHSCPASGPAPGVTAGRFIENVDFRATKADPRDPAVDPNIKPIQQHEFVTGVDWAITPNWSLETRYSRKRLDQTIEDMAITDNLGFYIGNPGSAFQNHILHGSTVIPCGPASDGFPCTPNAEGNYLNTTPFCSECPNLPGAIRDYDGLEFRLTKRPGSGRTWFGSVSYTYSKLRGNYAGLTNTDITDGNGGRHAPNNGRAFDLPNMSFLPNGKADNGPLATDRPNTLKIFGYYRLPWLRNDTTIGISQAIFQGTPNSTCLSVIGTSSSCQWAEGRGNFVRFNRDNTTGDWSVASIERDSRTPAYLQTDLSLNHQFRVSKTNEQQRIGFEVNITNLFNQRSVMALNQLAFFTGQLSPTRTKRFSGDPGFDWNKVTTGYNYIQEVNHNYGTGAAILSQSYGKPILYQGTRNMRLAIRYTF